MYAMNLFIAVSLVILFIQELNRKSPAKDDTGPEKNIVLNIICPWGAASAD
jgi:hypothetical protein